MSYTHKDGSKVAISGGKGKYSVHIDYMGNVKSIDKYGYKGYKTGEKAFALSVDRDIVFESPKETYLPGEPGPGSVSEKVVKKELRKDCDPIWHSVDGIGCPGGGYEVIIAGMTPSPRPMFMYVEERRETKPTIYVNSFGDIQEMMIIQRVTTPFGENCYVRNIYTYKWEKGKK